MFIDSTGLDRYHLNKSLGYLYYYADGFPLTPAAAFPIHSGWNNPAYQWSIPNGRYEMLPIESSNQPGMCDQAGNCWFIPFRPLSEMPLRDGLPRCTSIPDGGSGRCGFHPEDNLSRPGTNGCVSFPQFSDSKSIRDFLVANPANLTVSGEW
jgi:hypothetical protein